MPEIPRNKPAEYVNPVEPIDEIDFDPSREDESKRFEQTLRDVEPQLPKSESTIQIDSNVESAARKAMDNISQQINKGSEILELKLDKGAQQKLQDELKRKMLAAQFRSK